MNRIFVPPTTIAYSARVAVLFNSLPEKAKVECFTAEAPHVTADAEVLNVEQTLCVLAARHLGLNRIWVIQE